MRRVLLSLALAALLLAGCGGGASDTTIPDPPKAQVFSKAENDKIQQVITGWQQAAPATMKANAVKPETLQEKIYTSSATLQEVADFYTNQLVPKGWVAAPRMPHVQGNVLLTGYESGNNDVVIGAFDAKEFGGSGVVVYILKGTR